MSEFLYYADLGDGLVEHELDHVLVGQWNGAVRPHPAEVSETRWVDREALLTELVDAPQRFTPWMQSVVYYACRNAPTGRSSEADAR